METGRSSSGRNGLGEVNSQVMSLFGFTSHGRPKKERRAIASSVLHFIPRDTHSLPGVISGWLISQSVHSDRLSSLKQPPVVHFFTSWTKQSVHAGSSCMCCLGTFDHDASSGDVQCGLMFLDRTCDKHAS